MRAHFQFCLLDTGNLHVVAVEKFGEFLRGPMETVAIPLHKSFRHGRRRRRSRRARVRVNTGAEKEDEDEKAGEEGRTRSEVAMKRKRREIG